MKVEDIKVFNPDDVEVTDKLILNTEFAIEFITHNIQDNLKFDQICRIFRELHKFYTIDVEFDRVEFDFKNKELNAIYYLVKNREITLKVYLKG